MNISTEVNDMMSHADRRALELRASEEAAKACRTMGQAQAAVALEEIVTYVIDQTLGHVTKALTAQRAREDAEKRKRLDAFFAAEPTGSVASAGAVPSPVARRECPDCEGEGEVYVGATFPDDDGFAPCDLCGGTGIYPSEEDVRNLRRELDRVQGDLAACDGELQQWKDRRDLPFGPQMLVRGGDVQIEETDTRRGFSNVERVEVWIQGREFKIAPAAAGSSLVVTRSRDD